MPCDDSIMDDYLEYQGKVQKFRIAPLFQTSVPSNETDIEFK